MYPVPPSPLSPRAFCLPFPILLSVSEFISGIRSRGGVFLFVFVYWREGRGGGGALGFVYLGSLPKEVKPRAILALGSLHADPVCRHPGSAYTAMSGAHQGDCNPTLDVSTRL